MNDIKKIILERLFQLQDLKYRDFQCKLMPTIEKDTVIGVRTPEMRKLAKEFAKLPDINIFLNDLPHKYYEENNLHGFIIEQMKDYDTLTYEINRFLPYVDNWATCDLISPKAYKKHLDKLYEQIKLWIASDYTYTIRFGIEMLMSFYLDGEKFKDEFNELVASVKSEEYYVKMMVAWYFATALAKQYDATLPYIEQERLDKWTHNKTIQKAVESYRITDEQKAYLKTMKIRT